MAECLMKNTRHLKIRIHRNRTNIPVICSLIREIAIEMSGITFLLLPGQIVDRNYGIGLGGSASNYGGFLRVGISSALDSYSRDWGTFCVRPRSVPSSLVSHEIRCNNDKRLKL